MLPIFSLIPPIVLAQKMRTIPQELAQSPIIPLPKQEAHHKVGLDETPRCLIRKLPIFFIREFEDAFDAAYTYLLPHLASFSSYKPFAAFWGEWCSVSPFAADGKELMMPFPAGLWDRLFSRSCWE